MSAPETPPSGAIGADVVVKVADAKARLSELIQRAEAGERVIISRGDNAVVELRPVPRSRSPVGLYVDLAGPVDMDRLHAELDAGWSEGELDELEGDLERELRRE